ncbi:uncharacterized protein LOC129304366 [Prosopis cineraria]|uniref:uncharacterized protein LOC129304366 n=1 Tax=Prosopis cineraria TaxID=364024 RepID=UPI002410B56F|nr:uncharacterized protein LOC129304366 [Prosopis cineraria]
MAGNNRQRKSSSSSSFTSIFNIFRSSRREDYSEHSGEGTSMGWTKVWRSDEDRGQWGAAEPGIDKKAADFIARYKKKVTESEVHCLQAPVE